MAAKKAKAAKPAVANMGAGADEQNATQAAKGKEPSHGDRLDRLEALAKANGWSM